jgi:hypothetical protein
MSRFLPGNHIQLRVTVYEWTAVVFFSAFAVAAWAARAPLRSRARASVLAGVTAALVVVAASELSDSTRSWLPHLYLAAGYWAPALLVEPQGGPTRFEAWLIRLDTRTRAPLPRVPPVFAGLCEVAYLLCYPLVPASFTVVWLTGDAGDAARFWTAVLIAGYSSYATLPWLVSRPPRLIDAHHVTQTTVGAVNESVLRLVSHQLNTFPSGHVAVAWAAAFSVGSVSIAWGAGIAGLALAISVGAVAGRYHYLPDVVLGFAVAVAAVAWTGAV